MPLKVWDGSAFKEVSKIKVWDGATFGNVANAYSWNGSAWIQWYPGVFISDITAFNYSLAGIGGTASATYRLASTGVASRTLVSGTLVSIPGQWLIAGSASDYEVQGTVIFSSGGGSLVGPGAGWNNLGTTRDWSLTATNDFAERDLLIEIRPVGSTSTAISATISINVDSAP
jgi:hypothetical protein